MRRSMRIAFFSLGISGSVAGIPTAVAAQWIEGRLTEEASGQPVAGAQVVLADEGGSDLQSVLTGPTGAFRLRAPAPGVYRVRADRIGYRSTWSELLRLGAADTVALAMKVPTEAVDLGAISVQVDQRCRDRSDGGSAVSVVWEEARKALTAARLTAKAPLQYTLERYTRRLKPRNLLIIDEARTVRHGYFSGSPFASRSAAELTQRGYVVADPSGDILYFGPDASVLLSPVFLDQHCFRLTENPETPEVIGLTFEPVLARRMPDVRGTLWLDRATAELRTLDFRYTRLPWSGIVAEDFGGVVDFEQLATGDVIVRRWRIRMPVVGERQARRPGRASAEHFVAEVREAGGVIRDVQTATGEILAQRSGAVVSGTVTEAGGGPAAGVRVRLDPLGQTAITGPNGVFRLEGIREGIYSLLYTHPAIPAPLRLERVVEIAADASLRVDLSLPLPTEILRMLCPGDTGTAVFGVVRDSMGAEPIAGAEVHLTWSRNYQIRQTTGFDPLVSARRAGGYTTDVAITESWNSLRTETGPDGSYYACGLPSEHLVLARAWAEPPEAAPGGTLTVTELAGQTLRWIEIRTEPDVPVRIDLPLAPPR